MYFFYCFSNYFSIIHACIKVRLVYKIPLVIIPKLTKIISDQATMLFGTDGYVISGNNIEYVRFNLPELSSIAGFTHSNNYFLPITTKISNFIYGIQYLLFEIILEKITLPTKPKHLLLCLSFRVSNSFNL